VSVPLPVWTPALVPVDLDGLAGRLRLLRAGIAHYDSDLHHHHPLLREQLYALDRSRNPLLEDHELQGLIVDSAGRDVARLVVRARPGGVACFSHFENSLGEAEARLLIAGARDWARQRGCTSLIGPVGIRPEDPAGVQTDGFVHPPTAGTPHNPPAYGPQLEATGLRPRWRLPAWRWELAGLDPVELAERTTRLKRKLGITTRIAQLSQAHDEIALWAGVLARSGGEPWRGEHPVEALGAALASQLPRHALPGMVVFAERQGVPCGVIVTIPDVNQIVPRSGLWGPLAWIRLIRQRQSLRQGRVRYLAACDSPGDDSISRLLLWEAALRGREHGLDWVELSCGSEQDHLLVRLARELGARRTRAFAIYGSDLDDIEERH
jgi:hypothetical protein